MKETENREKMKIDWVQVRAQIDKAGKKIRSGDERTASEKRKILRSRTREFAREKQQEKKVEEYINLLIFLLANEIYGIETRNVIEVFPLKDLTPMPCAPLFILGIFNVRGQIQTVLDIKKIFDLPDKGLSDNKVIIVRARGMEAGILADVILGIRSIPLREIQPALPTLTDIRAEYMKGVTGDQLIVLDVEKIFLDERIIVNEEV
ncbi:MAG: purine-binding chemotaxis protein CheW [Bacteroidales bacterium]|nr:purine-binding chemotaxis protein CheW [Bacteroidales bacterium]